jgi:hypothetical protein
VAPFFLNKTQIKSTIMAQKENKGGLLTNEQVEQDLKAKGKTNESETGHVGLQDTGDSTVPAIGTNVQRNQGWDNEEQQQK